MDVDEIVVERPVGSVDELPPDDFVLVMPDGLMSSKPPDEGRILVFDLGMHDPAGIASWLSNASEEILNSTIVVLGTAEQIANAQEPLASFDVTFVEKPERLPDERILQFLYDDLGSVYAPFRRYGVQFMPASVQDEENPATPPASGRQQILKAAFGEYADTVEPKVSELDPVYSKPTEFTADEYREFLARLGQPETEKRTDPE